MAKRAYHFMVPSSFGGELIHAAVVSADGWSTALRRLEADDPVWRSGLAMIVSTEGYELPRETGLQFSDRRMTMWLSDPAETAHA